MKKTLFAATFLGLMLSANAAYSAPSDIIAKVNNKTVTKGDIDNALSSIADPAAKEKPSFDNLPPEFQKGFLDKYIDKVLTVEAAKKAGIQQNPEVKKKLQEIEEVLIQQKFLSGLVNKNITEAKLKKLYDEKLKTFDGKEEVHAQHILVKTEEEAKKLREQIDKGASFEKLAKEKSIEPGAKVSGGDLGYFTEDRMVPEFSEAAFKLKKGEISQPVKTTFGWHIIKLVDKRKKTLPSFAEAKDSLQSEAALATIEEETKKLRESAKIQYLGDAAKLEEAKKPAADHAVTKTIPAAEKPAADQKPAETKTETKPAAEQKPAETKPSEEKKAEAPAKADAKPAATTTESPASAKSAEKPVTTSNINQKAKTE